MWFRKTESPEVDNPTAPHGVGGGAEGGSENVNPTAEPKNNNTNANANNNSDFKAAPPPLARSKFEKFRRASFRRKSSTNQIANTTAAAATTTAATTLPSTPRKRSKSPHFILRSSLEAAAEEDEEDPSESKRSNEKNDDDDADDDDEKNANKKDENKSDDKHKNKENMDDDINANENANNNPTNAAVANDDGTDDDEDDENDDTDEDDVCNDNDNDMNQRKFNDKQQSSSASSPLRRPQNTPTKAIGENQTVKRARPNKKNNTIKENSANISLPLCDPPVKTPAQGKKPSLKSLKSDPPKRNFYKSFASRRQKLRIDSTLDAKGAFHNAGNAGHAGGVAVADADADADADDALPAHGKEKILLTDPKFRNNRIEKSSSKTKIGDLEKRESIKRSRSGRKISAAATAAAAVVDAVSEEVNKSKNLHKMKKNKSQNVDKSTTDHHESNTKFTRTRTYSNLNLTALVKFVMNNKKLLNTNDFALMRRKSISEAASSIIAVAATCKPLPIALKYTADGGGAGAGVGAGEIATAENDAKTVKNVVLVKKQKLKNSFCDRLNNNYSNNHNNTNNNNNNFNKTENSQEKSVAFSNSTSNNNNNNNNTPTNIKVKRNSSNSSKSSGNFEDEAFYSCDEQDLVDKLKTSVDEETVAEEGNGGGGGGDNRALVTPEMHKTTKALKSDDVNTTTASSSAPSPASLVPLELSKRKSSSPSLTSRVAAKINETTNNYKNRKAAAAAYKTAAKKQRKSLAAASQEQRPECYKPISVERLHSTSIVRQPSDRRPDAANASIRSNGNTSQPHNSNSLDLHNSHASETSTSLCSTNADALSAGGGGAGGGSGGAGSGGGGIGATGGISNVGFGGSDGNAQDAPDNSRDSRRDRLQQQHQQNKSAPVSVNRSESYKERLSHKRSRNSRRKTSDPSLASRPNDDQTDVGLSNSNYTASSNSSLSSGGGSESPSTSMEQVGTAAGVHHQQSMAGHGAHQQPQQQQQHHHPHLHHHHHHHQNSHQDSFHGSTGGSGSASTANNSSFWGGSIGGTGSQLTRQFHFDSEEEDDLLIEADWSSNVAAEILAALTDAEKKRQEIINEIYQTERNHVRTLKLLERLFFCPLQESGVLSHDHLLLLFPPALLSLRELHSSFEQKLKQRRIEHTHVVNQVGDLLAGMFDGQPGEVLCEYAAQFCARQQIALEALKEKRRKDENLQKILSKAESHKACRRLQLKDLLPTVLQRLTKYPLLFETLYKVTIRVVPDDVAEAEAIKRAMDSSKKILVDVNQAVKHAEDAHKLQNIQRKLDKSTFDKDEFKNLDLTQYRLIHDGSLTMKKNPGIQLHGLLFENMIVLLTKQDDKYSLKYLNATRISEVNNKPLSPIMNIDAETLVRQEAADKNSFFLIKTKTSQMLELRAPSSSECKTWFKHISDAAEQYKPRSKNSTQEPLDDPAIATLPHSSTKESLEITPERTPPACATATVITTPLAPMMMTPTNNYTHHQHPHPHLPHQPHSHQHHHSVDLSNGRDGGRTFSSDMGASVPMVGGGGVGGGAAAAKNNRYMNSNDLSSSVNRTMSTRSCGESNSNSHSHGHGHGHGHNNNYNESCERLHSQMGLIVTANGVTLRHTQSARQAATNAANTGSGSGDDAGFELAADGGGGSKRDSASIIYSNNSNNTRTLMQSCALVDPTAIQISISPAHTAEPVLTPAEKLRRLDAAIRDGLLEKQKIICDMFRLPVEHFHEIVDIASLPEAPKDSADIALATYAQVQSLTEVVNEYMKVTPEQEISAVSSSVSASVCDQCHEKQRKQQQHNYNNSSGVKPPTTTTTTTPSNRPLLSSSTSLPSVGAAPHQRARSPSPPPLPPPNKQQAQAQHKTATPSAKRQTHSLDEQIIHEDDDGYCEIDELRLPALPSMMPAAMMAALLSKPVVKPATTATTTAAPPPPLPPPAGTFKAPAPPPPPPPPAAAAVSTQAQATAAAAAATMQPATAAAETTAAALAASAPASTVTVAASISSAAERALQASNSNSRNSPELTKRQSTISAESIPEESADEVTKAMGDEVSASTAATATLSDNSAVIAKAPAATEEAAQSNTVEEQKALKVSEDGMKQECSRSVEEEEEPQLERDQQQLMELLQPAQEKTQESGEAEDATTNEQHKLAQQPERRANAQEEQRPTTSELQASDAPSTGPQATNAADKADKSAANNSPTVLPASADVAHANETEEEEEEEKEDDSRKQQDATEAQHNNSAASNARSVAATQLEGGDATTATTLAEAQAIINKSQQTEMDEVCDTLAALNKIKTSLTMVDSTSQTTLSGHVFGGITNTNVAAAAAAAVATPTPTCGANRLKHATTLEPSVPCHALNSIVNALNVQISLLLPKINERDMERERLRKENQHLRELLNAMHERQRVEAKIETPKDINTTSAAANSDEIDAPSSVNNSNNNNNNTATIIDTNTNAVTTASILNTKVIEAAATETASATSTAAAAAAAATTAPLATATTTTTAAAAAANNSEALSVNNK